MKKRIVIPLLSLALTACGVDLAIMDKSEAVKAEPEIPVKTSGDFWGFGREGTFEVAGLYHGKYSRDISESNWFFNRINIKDGSLVAEVTKNSDNTTWLLVCSGGGTSVHYLGVDFGGVDPYTCKISLNDKPVGEYKMEPDSSFIKIGIEKKETGFMRLGNDLMNVETVHSSDSLLMPVEMALGYSFKLGSREVAATQSNGMITIQMLSTLTESQKDTVVVGSIASALSWRPDEE